MTDYEWQPIRDKAIEAFNDAPSAQLEQEILGFFSETPSRVASVLEYVAAQIDQGKPISSGWAVARARLRDAANAPSATSNDLAERTKRAKNAERWMRNAGLHFDRLSEITDELFGDRGMLRDYKDDLELHTRMVNLWHEVRPTGELIEQQAEERAEQYKKTQAKILTNPPANPPAKEPELEPALTQGADDDDIPF